VLSAFYDSIDVLQQDREEYEFNYDDLEEEDCVITRSYEYIEEVEEADKQEDAPEEGGIA